MSHWIDIPANKKKLQKALQDKGLYKGPLDGILGPASAKSVSDYRKSIGLTEGAVIDAKVLSSLNLTTEPKPMLSLLPTIVQWIVALLPGIPDDIAIVEAELKELASTDSGKQKLVTALAFGKTLISKIEAVLEAHP